MDTITGDTRVCDDIWASFPFKSEFNSDIFSYLPDLEDYNQLPSNPLHLCEPKKLLVEPPIKRTVEKKEVYGYDAEEHDSSDLESLGDSPEIGQFRKRSLPTPKRKIMLKKPKFQLQPIKMESNEESEESDPKEYGKLSGSPTLACQVATQITDTREVWWVNQGSTFENDKQEVDLATLTGHLRCPPINEGQRKVPSWERIHDIKVGDLVVHYAAKHIRAISVVTSALIIKNKVDNEGSLIRKNCRMVQVGSITLLDPQPRYEDFFPTLRNIEIEGGPMNQRQTNQGYIFRLSWRGLLEIQRHSNCIWPSWANPVKKEEK